MNIELHKRIRKAITDGDCDTAITLLKQNPEMLEVIIPVFGTWLHIAASSGFNDIVKYLLLVTNDINTKSGVLKGSPLNQAASYGHFQTVSILLKAGAKLDTSEPERNPLFSAIYSGSLDIVKMLIDHGIDWKIKYNGKNMKNMDAIAFARERGQIQIAEYLESLT